MIRIRRVPIAPLSRRLIGPGLLLAGIVALAAVLRLAGLSAVALRGDEYLSIGEATTRFGANLTSLLYSAILHVMLTLGNSVDIMRLPAVIFGILAVPALYLFAGALVDRPTALVAALLGATSSYAIGYAQEVRFYSLFLCAGTLALYAAARVARDGATRPRIILLLLANAFCLAAHIMGVLIIGVELISLLWLMSPPERVARRLLTLVAVVAVGALLVTIPQVRALGYHALTRSFDNHVSYTTPRGVHLTNLVKLGWNFFVFVFGERVYPLWLRLTIPGALLVVVLLARGLWSLRGNCLALGMLLPQLVIVPLVLYGVVDAVTAPGLPAATPRYLIPLLSPFLVLVAAGITSWRARWLVGLSLALAIVLNGAALADYWHNTWDYNGYAPDWPRAAALVARAGAPGTVILVDGRSAEPARYYLREIERARRLGEAGLTPETMAGLPSAPRVITMANTDIPGNQAVINSALDALQERYTVVDGFVRYPLFVYVLASKARAARSKSAGWRSLPAPVDLYGLALQDLALPVTLRLPDGGAGPVVRGALTLSSAPSVDTRVITLARPVAMREALLATTLDNDSTLPDGSPVAALTLTFSGRADRQTITLYKGRQVDDWRRVGSKAYPPGARYTAGYTWVKLISLVGQRGYPDAYRQFTAGIAVTTLPVSGQSVTGLTLRYLAPSGTLHVWAVAAR